MRTTAYILSGIILCQSAIASQQTEEAQTWVRTFYLTPNQSTDKVVLVREQDTLWGFHSHQEYDGTWTNSQSENHTDIPFTKEKMGYLYMTPKESGALRLTDSLEKFRQELTKLGTIQKETEGLATVKMNGFDAIFSPYAIKHPNHVKQPIAAK